MRPYDPRWLGVRFRPGMVEIGPVASVEAFNAFVMDVKADRIDAGGWPTRDRAAPEEEC